MNAKTMNSRMRQLDDVPSGIPKTKEKGVLNPESNISKNRRRNVLGETDSESRMYGHKNYSNLIMNFSNPFTQYAVYALAVIASYALGSQVSTVSATNTTIKMCNERQLECKFKYDILVYNETGKVPVPPQVTPVKKQP